MPSLNTRRSATVLTHPLTCFSHAEYHFCVTVYQSDVKSELQSVYKENLTFTRFTLFSLTRISIDMHSSCRIPLLWDCLSIWCANLSYKVFTNWTLTGFTFSPEIISIKFSHIHWHAIVIQNTHFCATVYRSDVQSELQSVFFTTLILTGFKILPELVCVHQVQLYRVNPAKMAEKWPRFGGPRPSWELA